MSNHIPVSSRDESQAGEDSPGDFRRMGAMRLWSGLAAVILLILAFAPVLLVWCRIAMGSDLHSHVILIPLVSIYLLATDRAKLAWDSKPAKVTGGLIMLAAGSIIAWTLVSDPSWSEVDLTALKVFALIGFVWGVGFMFGGRQWMRSAIFPMGFLLFMIPLPDLAVEGLERFLMVMSARLAELVFSVGGIPNFRHGQVIELPGMVLQVAKECSGIRSSWVLLITSTLAAYLFLPTVPRRIALVAAVLPLGILRNAVRIYVIGWLCVHVGPEMIDSWIHHKGGPVFFAASLVPLFLMAWWLRRRKVASPAAEVDPRISEDVRKAESG